MCGISYAPNSELYPIKGLTMDEVYAAIFEYKQRLLKVSYNITPNILKHLVTIILTDMVIV